MPGASTRRPRGPWRWLVPLTALGAGLLFATSASTARGTDLRSGRRLQLTELITAAQADLATQEQAAARLRDQVSAAGVAAAAGSSVVAAERGRGQALAQVAGTTPVVGPALTVSLDDAPRPAPGRRPASVNPDDLVVHQQDVQSVVNGLWAGGAEAMTLMGERVISTSAVRCVGNTLLLHGRVYSPPFVVTAVGDPDRLRAALANEPGVALFRRYVDRFDLSYAVRERPTVRLPAYAGSLDLPHVGPAG